MNLEAAEILARGLEEDIKTQKHGDPLVIGEKWDDVYAELLPIEDDIDNPVYSLAFGFWDGWGDASNHNWLYYEPITEDQWPIYAKEITSSLRAGKLPENSLIIEMFSPKPKVNFIQKLKLWLSKIT